MVPISAVSPVLTNVKDTGTFDAVQVVVQTAAGVNHNTARTTRVRFSARANSVSKKYLDQFDGDFRIRRFSTGL